MSYAILCTGILDRSPTNYSISVHSTFVPKKNFKNVSLYSLFIFLFSRGETEAHLRGRTKWHIYRYSWKSLYPSMTGQVGALGEKT